MAAYSNSAKRQNSLMDDYSVVLTEALLRRRMRVAEHTAKAEAEIAARVKSEFIANMSHELRTPLNTVIGFSKMLAEQGNRRLADGEVMEYAALIRDSAMRLLTVINDILDISKLQSGHYRLDPRDVDMEELLSGLMSSMRKQAASANVEAITSFNCKNPVVKGEAAKLRQVLSNVVDNAIKFTPAGGQVRVELEEGDDGWVVITVRDTGVGMSEDEIAKALTPFGQVDAGKARWREGTGLGLPIARALTELHAGRISIASILKQGTAVTIALPPFKEGD